MMSGWLLVLVGLVMIAEGSLATWLWGQYQDRMRSCAKCEARQAMAVAHMRKLILACDALLANGDHSTGDCMCGSATDGHGMGDGHSPVDAGVHYATHLHEDATGLARRWLDCAYPTWLHPKRGTYYNVLSEGIRFNSSRPGLREAMDGLEVCLYQDKNSGKLSVREKAEFLDGRFQLLGHGAYGEEDS